MALKYIWHLSIKHFDFFLKVLTKHYKLRHGPDSESPLEYDGPEIVSCTGGNNLSLSTNLQVDISDVLAHYCVKSRRHYFIANI